jgi:hypothetical protein
MTSAMERVACIFKDVTMAIHVLTIPVIALQVASTVRRSVTTDAPALPILAIRLKDALILQKTATTEIPVHLTHATAGAIASMY